MTTGTRLRKYREKLRLSQKEVAELIGVSQTTYYNWEADKSSMKIEYTAAIVQVLKIDVFTLLPAIKSNQSNDSSTEKVRNENEDIHILYRDLISSKDEMIQYLKDENMELRNKIARSS
jgi:transcriptional regulator with XRE-family HTH domain